MESSLQPGDTHKKKKKEKLLSEYFILHSFQPNFSAFLCPSQNFPSAQRALDAAAPAVISAVVFAY